MGIFNRNKKMIKQLTEAIESKEKLLNITLQTLQSHTIAVNDTLSSTYQNRATQVKEIIKKFHGAATYGNQLTQRIVNLRVAFSVPNRLFCVSSGYGDESSVNRTKEYIKNFLAFNRLDSSLPRELARESEFHGMVLVELKWNDKEKLPEIYYYPSDSYGYTVKPESKGFVNSKLSAEMKYDGREWVIPNDKLCFVAFNDRLNDYVGYPTCGGILTTIENVDKDLRDWRMFNHLFAHYTPHFECESQEEATKINETIAATGWKVGTALATKAKFSLVGPQGSEGNLLMLSIQTGVKIISGHCGISIHFLGFANVMSNRATADSMGEPTEVVLHSEIGQWESFYIDMFNKVIAMRNSELNSEINASVVRPKILPLTDRQYKTVLDLYGPFAEKGLLSKKTFLENIPGVDADAEQGRLDEEAAKAAENASKMDDSNSDSDEESSQEDDMNDGE